MPTSLTPSYAALQQQLGIANPHAVPHVTHVVVNVGVGKNRDNKAYIEAVQQDLALITGQKPHERRARKAIAGFNVRENNIVGYRVTLRGQRMADFIQRFVHITLPRVRDFRGLSRKSLDGRGNLSVGLREQLVFPEIHPEKTDVVFGVQVTFATTAYTNAAGEALFRTLGFPLVTDENVGDLETEAPRGKQAKAGSKRS